MKGSLIVIFGLGAFCDVTTSFLGISGLFGVTELNLSDFDSLGNSLGVLVTALIASLIILGLSLIAEEMWDQYADNTYKLLRPIHVFGVGFDAYTSYLGTAQNIILRDSRTSYITIELGEVWQKTSFNQQIVLLFITILITISPIMVSKLRDQ